MVVGNKVSEERLQGPLSWASSNQPGLCPAGNEAPMMTFKRMSDTTTLTF